MNWMKQQLANVAGTAEPVYGPSAIQPVTAQAEAGPAFTEVTKANLRWAAPRSTCVETQVYYITADDGRIYMCQLIYSNVAGIRTTCQFNTKVFDHGKPGEHQWTSDPLSNQSFDKEHYCFHADKVAVDLSEDGSSITIKSPINPKCIVDVKFTRTAPGFVAGKDGTSHFGTDPQHPWGSMYHAFWPRCKVEGTFTTGLGKHDVSGKGCFAHALQGMKPHHAAASWNFVDFQGPTHSAVMMEFTTPPSYGSTVVNVGGIVTDDKLLYAGVLNKATHTTTKQDKEVDWLEPASVRYEWNSSGTDPSQPKVELSTTLERADRVDVMAEVPGFVKQIVAGAAGTRPYIYQYTPKTSILLSQNGKDIKEDGTMFMEATFISK